MTDFEIEVRNLKQNISDMQAYLNSLLEECKHDNLIKKSKFYSGGYDHKSESHYWDECSCCGKMFNKEVSYGGYQ